MPTDELIAAIRTGTAEEIAEAIYQRFSGDIRDDQGLEIAEAIVAARDKPEDVAEFYVRWGRGFPETDTISRQRDNCEAFCREANRPADKISRVTITREPTNAHRDNEPPPIQ